MGRDDRTTDTGMLGSDAENPGAGHETRRTDPAATIGAEDPEAIAAMQARSKTVRGAPPLARESLGGNSGRVRCHTRRAAAGRQESSWPRSLPTADPTRPYRAKQGTATGVGYIRPRHGEQEQKDRQVTTPGPRR